MAKKKYYVVWKGRSTGVFEDWETCKAQVYGFAGARYKSFPDRAQAEAAYAQGGSGAAAPRSTRPVPGRRATAGRSPTVKTYTEAEITEHPARIKIFTDGGCEPNPGEAGSGVAVYRDNAVTELWYGLYNPSGTNNTAELSALLEALRMAQSFLNPDNTVAIFCDSQYAIQCVTQWAPGWEKKGWKRKDGEIKNLDLIQPLYALHQQLKDVLPLLHVNGHVGVEGNELADRMSMHAIATRERGFVRYEQPINVAAILATRSG